MAECSGFIVDVSHRMVQNDNVSKVQAYLEYTLLEKCKRKRKTDWISCYLANCAICKNSQRSEGVFQVQDWVAPVTSADTLRVLRQLQSYSEDIRRGHVSSVTSSSMVQCLLVSSLDCRECFRAKKMRRQLVVFSDDMEGLDLSDQEVGVLTEELNLSIILVDCRATDDANGTYGVWGKLIEAVDGSRIYKINELLRVISSLPSGVVRPVTVFSGELRLGGMLLDDDDEYDDAYSLSIRVEGYPATKLVSSISRKMVVKREIHGKDVYEPVKSVVEYEIAGEKSGMVQVSAKSITKAYRYGSDYVVLPSSLDHQSGEYASKAGMDILGFVSQKSLPRHFLHSESRFIIADTKNGGIQDIVAISALVDALKEAKQLAIVRFVVRPGSDVQIGMLCPIHVEKRHALVYCRLPFAEDQRVADFPRLIDRRTTSGKKIDEGDKSRQDNIDSLMSKYIDAFDMDDEPETQENQYYTLMQPPSPTSLPLPQYEMSTKLQDPLIVPAIHLHRTQQVLLEWIHLCIIGGDKFRIPEMPDFLAIKISPRCKRSQKLDESIAQLKKLLNIRRSQRVKKQEESDVDEEGQDIPDLEGLLSKGNPR